MKKLIAFLFLVAFNTHLAVMACPQETPKPCHPVSEQQSDTTETITCCEDGIFKSTFLPLPDDASLPLTETKTSNVQVRTSYQYTSRMYIREFEKIYIKHQSLII